ncbi:glycosyltransferase family 2 protein [Spirosoma soli]|uniref:Glycosyltransferase family 2 protein n=1 Tax=Spirosoma soli TaxID=1770529 RepID=A0ABW5M8H6_9BACT
MNQPVLSVLMPVYNAEKYLVESIESILGQSLEEFEFIIIDDGSTDSSPQIVQSFTDKRIRFYQNGTNLGISTTLNKGIELAKTELIARMDADDISYPDRLREQYQYMVAHPDCALLSCWVRVIGEDKEVIRVDRFAAGYHYYNMAFISPMYHPSVLYRRSAVLEVGGYAQKYAEDYALFWALSRKYRIYNVEQVLLDYRVSSSSLHQVLRKQEYETAHAEQVLGNLRYYMGNEYQLGPSYLACLSHNFGPLLQENSVQQIVECLKQLETINEKIFTKPNVNLDLRAVKQAAISKRNFIISYYTQHLGYGQKVGLLLRTGSWRILYRTLRDSLNLRNSLTTENT